MLRTSKLYTETEFLSLAQSLEAFGRILSTEEEIPAARFKAGLKFLSENGKEIWGSKEFAKRSIDALANINEPTFAQRIYKIIKLLSVDFAQRLIGDASEFSKSLRQTRNFYTHLGIKRGAAVLDAGKELYLFNRKIHALLRAVLLLDLGIPEESLRDGVFYDSNRWF